MNHASERLLTHFTYGHLPEPLQQVSKACADLAIQIADALDSTDPVAGAEVTTGLRKLLEAKDCFVRAKLQLTWAAEQTRVKG
jgi:hypothetical protein